MDQSNVCAICFKNLDNNVEQVSIVRARGLATLIDKSKLRGDNKWVQWNDQSCIYVHEGCRKRYGVSERSSSKSLPRQCTSTDSAPPCTSTDSATPMDISQEDVSEFNFTEFCFICGRKSNVGSKMKIVTDPFMTERQRTTAELRNDEIGEAVLQRLRNVPSLTAVEARYHNHCFVKFTYIPKRNTDESTTLTQQVMEKVYEYIQSKDKSQIRLSELKKVMGADCLPNKTVYRCLRQKYGADIYVSTHGSRDTIIYFQKYDISKICSDWMCDDEALGEIEKKRVLSVAAGIVKAEIMAMEYKTDSYKSPHNFLEGIVDEVPESLNYFISNVIVSDDQDTPAVDFVKRDQIAHSIVSATRPSFNSHLQLAIGTYVHNKSGSKLIVDLLSKLGVSASYYHLQLLNASSIVHSSELKVEDAFVQYVFDNTDHNANTLDGHNTFHSLGGIAIYTPEFEVSVGDDTIKKCTKMPTASEIASYSSMEMKPYSPNNNDGLKNIIFEDTDTLFPSTCPLLTPYYSLYLWGHALNVKNLPSWRGFMEVLSQDLSYSVSRIQCLPFINAPPSKLTTINTALYYAQQQSQKLKQKHVFVTFDHPLYMKACEVKASSGGQMDNVINRIGGFHMLMSYLGTIGYVMKDSGLEEMWGVVYAPQSVQKMLLGKAFSRALRAHILTFTALGAEICKHVNGSTVDQYRPFLTAFLSKWVEEPPTMGDCKYEKTIIEMTAEFQQQLLSLKENGPTAKLWLQYFECVLVVLQFIEAERLGNWKLHLESVRRMLPLFHAAGHFQYAKSAQMYLQDMSKLEIIMDDKEYHRYTEEGYFTIRRSDKAWSGIWTDMTIEQTLNRFFGTDLKHGRGVTPSVIARYLLSMPTTFSILNSLEDYCGITSSSSEQHIDLSTSRINRDHNDVEKIKLWLNEHQPFKIREKITSLSCGIVGTANINCHNAIEIGSEGMSRMVGSNAANLALSTKFKVKTLADAKHGLHIDEKFIAVDCTLLFQRISVLIQGNEDILRQAFDYELAPFPLSIFNKDGYMRKNKKSELYTFFKPTSDDVLSTCKFIVDGGFLLHQVSWPEASTYAQICKIYYSYIIKMYGSKATIVFDGYSNEKIGVKSYERYCRKETNIAPDVDFNDKMLLTMNQTKFLSNVCNKFKFVKMLGQYLQNNGLQVIQAEEDADVLIVRTAINIKTSTTSSVTVVGNDVDLMVLLTALAPKTEKIYFYKVSPQNKKNILYNSQDQEILQPFILFAHAFSGCDTTSGFYGKGKKNIVKLLKKQPELQSIATVFYNRESTGSLIDEAAVKMVRLLYGDEKNLPMGELRYYKFVSLLSSCKTEAKLAQLPPTLSALHQHAKRVFYQVQLWLGNVLLPDQWGWRRASSYYFPILNTKEPAPNDVLVQISCNCSTNCQGSRCGCRKSGLRCSQFCKNCNGISCTNASLITTSDAEHEQREAAVTEDSNNDAGDAVITED